MLRSIVAVLVVLLLGAAGAGAYLQYVMVPGQQAKGGPGGRPGMGGPVAVEAGEVRVGPAVTSIDAVGTLVSNESVVLRPEVSGRVTAINFTEGARVRAGDLLVELDSSIERAQLAQADAQLNLARSNFERASELRRSNAGTQRALDEAQAAIRMAEAEVALARARLEKRLLVAPFEARAGLRHISLGEFVESGDEIVNLAQIDPLKVDFRVPELFLPAVAAGQRISLSIDAFPDEAFEGVVRAIDPQIDQAGRAVVVRAVIENDDGKLRPGLFVRVRLTLAEREEAIFVPEQAILPQGDKQFVFLVEAGAEGQPAQAKMTPVELGLRRGGEVEVTQGLQPGNVIVTAGLLKVRDGVPVAVQPPPGTEPPPADPAPPTAQGGGPAVKPAAAATRPEAG